MCVRVFMYVYKRVRALAHMCMCVYVYDSLVQITETERLCLFCIIHTTYYVLCSTFGGSYACQRF